MARRGSTHSIGQIIGKAIAPAIIGSAAVAAAGYGFQLTFGIWWPPEVIALRHAEDVDLPAFYFLAGFQLFGAFLLLMAPLLLASGVRKRQKWKREVAEAVAAGDVDAATRPAPGPPAWTRRPDWAEGRAVSTGDGRGPLQLIFHTVIFAITVAFALLFTSIWHLDETDTWIGILFMVWLFPVFGALGVTRQLHRLWLRVALGTTVFEMDAVPGLVGGTLSGHLRTRVRPSRAPDDGFKVDLTCYRRILMRSSEGRNATSRTIVYRDEQRVRPIQDPETGRLTLPIAFEIPVDAHSTGLRGGSLYWSLGVHAEMPGTDYTVNLSVPVYGGAAARAAAEAPLRAGGVPTLEEYAAHRIPAMITEPVTPGVHVSLDASGVLRELRIGARAGVLAGGAMTVTAVLMLGAIPLARLAEDAPFWAVPVLAVTGLILLLVGLRYLTFSTSLSLKGSMLTFRKGPLGFGVERTMATRHVEKVTVRATGGQIGNQALYAIRISPHGDEDFLVTDLLRDRAEADWIAGLLERAMEGGRTASTREIENASNFQGA